MPSEMTDEMPSKSVPHGGQQKLQFLQTFKVTCAHLAAIGQDDLLDEFFGQDLGWHYFSPFLKSKNTTALVRELAQVEWLRHSLRVEQAAQATAPANWRSAHKGEGDARREVLLLAPQAQWVYLTQELSEFQLQPGLWFILCQPNSPPNKMGEPEFINFQMKKEHALVIDLLSEGVSLARGALIDTLRQTSGIDCTKALTDLEHYGLVFGRLLNSSGVTGGVS